MKLVLAATASAALVLAAPFVGQLSAWLRRTAPGLFLPVVVTVVVALVGVGVVAAVRRIREQRGLRYGAIGAALAAGISYSLITATGAAEVDWAERVHFVEYGLIAFVFYRVWRSTGDASCVVLPLLAGLIVGLAEEWLQWFIPVRVGELHDVLLDLVAVACGLVFSVAADPPAAFSWQIGARSRRRLAVVGSLAAVGLAFFIDQVHLGHAIVRDGLEFRSHYCEAVLAQLARERAEQWQANPPLVLHRLSREDQYMDEGLWHVRRRNNGEAATAWSENRILEAFYAPVLDTPSYVSATGHRWAPAQRAEAEAAAAGDRAPFESQAEPYPIYTFPRWWLWSAAGILVFGAGIRVYGAWPQPTIW